MDSLIVLIWIFEIKLLNEAILLIFGIFLKLKLGNINVFIPKFDLQFGSW
jgi:hypothetical protein